jgi:hypothetical protein
MKMKLAIAIVLVLGAWLFAQTVQTAAPLAGYFPAGPMLYVEARDFSAELRRPLITENLEQERPVRPRL